MSYYYITIIGIVFTIGMKIYSSRRFVRLQDIIKKSAPVSLITDVCIIMLLLAFISEEFYSNYEAFIFVMLVPLIIFKIIMKMYSSSRLRYNLNLKYGFKSDYILTEGENPFIYYNQGDCRWRDVPYSGYEMNLEYTGCGPTVFAMAAATLLDDRTITPVDIAGLAQKIGLNRRGTEYEFMKTAANALNIPVKLYDTKYWSDALEEVKQGKLVIAVIHITENLFHYIIIRHILPDGKILIADPSNFADSVKPKNESFITKKLHDEPLPTLCILG